jgi:hypothetical protein
LVKPQRQVVDFEPEAPPSSRPRTITVTVPESNDAVDVEVTAYSEPGLGGDLLAVMRVRAVAKGPAIDLEIPLLSECKGIACPDASTCVAGGECSSVTGPVNQDAATQAGTADAGADRDGAADGAAPSDSTAAPAFPWLTHRSGTRLAVTGHSTAEGFVFPSPGEDGLFDRERQARCVPRVAGDGVLRCLPPMVAVAQGFVEPDCSKRVAIVRKDAGPHPVLALLDTTVCPKRFRVYQVIGPEPSVKTYHQAVGAAMCEPTASFFDTARSSVFQLGAEVPPSAFMELGETFVDTGQGVSVRYLDSPDGARFAAGFRHANGYTCRFAATQAGARCLPDVVASLGSRDEYSDPGCTQPVAKGNAEQCPPTPFVKRETARIACEDPVVTVNRTIAAQGLFFSTEPGQCRPPTRFVGKAFALGEEVPVSSFVAASVEPATDLSRRLAPQGLRIGPVGMVTGIFDNERQVPCMPALATDAKLRCLPSQHGFAHKLYWFADPKCEIALGTRDSGICAPGDLMSLLYRQSVNSSDNETFRFFKAAGPFQGQTYVRAGSDGCVAGQTLAPGLAVTLGSEIASDSFEDLDQGPIP